MARATTPTWLALDRWAEIMGIPPLFFNQLYSEFYTHGSECGDVWFQWMWQQPDRVGREDVADAIREAEDRLKSVVGYNLLPDWISDERVRTTRPARPELYHGTQGNIRGQLKSIQTRWAYIISGGQRKKDLLEAGVITTKVAGTVKDLDGDGYYETVEITVTSADVGEITDASEIHVYYPGESGEDEWEVKPIEVSISGNTATIIFKRWLIVDPDLQSIMDAENIDGDDDNSYLGTVDVYRVWNDPQSMATLLWENGCEDPACAFDTQTGCFRVRDERCGIIAYRPATWDSTNEHFDYVDYAVCRDPDQLRIWYYAGYESDSPKVEFPRTQLDPFWEKLIAYFAAALIDRDVCSCNNSERFIDYWREDLSRTGRDVAHQISPSDLDNPFGTTRGAIEAWRKINSPNSDWIVKR